LREERKLLEKDEEKKKSFELLFRDDTYHAWCFI
jgi:hypothetical protein